jgi:PAS domain S-box-containing protein
MATQLADVERVLAWRSGSVPTRLTQAALIALLTYVATNSWLAGVWFAGVVLTALIDAQLCRGNLARWREAGLERRTCISLGVSAFVYALVGLVLLANPSPLGVAQAALVLCAVMLNAAMMSRGAQPVTRILATPASVSLACLPLLAYAFGHRVALRDAAPLMIGAVAYIVFVARIAQHFSHESRMLQRVLAEKEDDREWLRQGIDAMNEAVALFDADDRLLLWNHEFASLAREGPAPSAGGRMADLLTAIAGDRAAALLSAWAGGELGKQQLHLGTGRWLSLEARELSKGGRILVAADITELKAKELSFQILFDDNPLAMLVIDSATHRITNVNEAALEAFGWPRDAMIGVVVTEFLPETEQTIAAHRLANLHDMVEPVAYAIVDGFGREREILPYVRPTVYEGAPALLAAILDVTTRKQAMEAMQQARDSAEAANRAKSDFLAMVSHEIRTPLNGVLGMAQAMANDSLPDRQRERLQVVSRSGTTLLAILNDILDLSKIEAGKLELEHADFDLSELALGAHAAFTALANAKGLSFDLQVAGDAEGAYRGDSVRVRQVLYNLISNAVKFTDTGEVRVKINRSASSIRFKVEDTGAGIAPERIDRLFEKFVQADSSTTRRYGGTGLGLAICAELCKAMGGSIQVESALGVGSRFVVELPLERVEADLMTDVRQRDAQTLPLGAHLRVLAAEDNPVNQLVLKTLLDQLGLWPTIVDNGAAALEAWERDEWDLVLMDVQMPLMDGPSAARELRAREMASGRRRTPIIALTANAMTHQIQSYRDSGMDAVVAKPISVGELFAAISDLCAHIEVEAADPANAA